MHYSYFSTGNVKIDSEHTNTDGRIDLCRTGDGEWLPVAQILISAVVNTWTVKKKIVCRTG